VRAAQESKAEFALYDIHSQAVAAMRWDEAERPIAAGSLLKPFLAVAYSRKFGSFPRHVCHGTRDGCWLPRGHGDLGIVEAIAHSCNAYFKNLADAVTVDEFNATLIAFGLPPMPANAQADELFGARGTWKGTPDQLTRAFAELAKRASEPMIAEVLRGMELSAGSGTAKAVHASGAVLAKTGTAPCGHKKGAQGDGFVVLMTPANSPRWVLLVRQHQKPGSLVALDAAPLLRAIEDPVNAEVPGQSPKAGH
jgi:cell division protein FtsI/penicillin-binding protein 2